MSAWERNAQWVLTARTPQSACDVAEVDVEREIRGPGIVKYMHLLMLTKRLQWVNESGWNYIMTIIIQWCAFKVRRWPAIPHHTTPYPEWVTWCIDASIVEDQGSAAMLAPQSLANVRADTKPIIAYFIHTPCQWVSVDIGEGFNSNWSLVLADNHRQILVNLSFGNTMLLDHNNR